MNKYIEAYNTMGNTGNGAIDFVFKICIIFLVDVADALGISYELLNLILFVFLQPILILLFFCLWIHARFVR